MNVALEKRLEQEVLHGATSTAVSQADFGWDSAAGRIRRERRYNFIIKGLTPEAKVLEVGAGTGLQTKGLLQYFKDVTGIDISPDLLKVAEQRAPGAHYLVMDAHKPDFAAETFDAVVGVSILHHLDWDMALKNIYSVLKPGGVIRFSEPNLLNPQIFLQKNIPALKRMVGDSPDEYAFTKWSIERSLREAGFREVNVVPYEFLHPGTPQSLLRFVIATESFVEKTPLRHIAGSLLVEAFR